MTNPLSPFLLLAFLLFGINLLQKSHATQNQNGFSLKMIHKYSPESPTYRANLTESEKFMEIFQISNARVKSIGSSLTSHNSNNLITRPSLGFFVSSYYVKLGIGTFKQFPFYDTYYLGIDTGSDLTWTQCDGCKKCFYQIDPYFKPSLSESYKEVYCNRCPSQCQGKELCRITRKYPDGSSVRAIGATETFNIPSEVNKSLAVPNVFFGCGEIMLNFGKANIKDNKISGILGLGYGSYSFWKQQYQVSQGRFSYCLQSPATAQEGKLPMYLRFGADVIEQTGMKSTPLHQYRDHSQYYLTLEGITVSNQKLPVGPTTFERKPDGSGGCIIDTGSYMTYIVSEAYNLLLTAVSKYIETNNQNLRKIEDPELKTRLCYERFKGPIRITLPIIKLHFSYSADFVMQPHAVFAFGYAKNGHGMICMMILESTQKEHYGITYLGAHQQSNQRIIFDNEKGQLLFGTADCANNN